jgi:thioredoxin reductase
MNATHPQNDFDAVVVGGSYAGQSAALQLARARRRVLVIDAGMRRNRFARHSHGFLGRDGTEAARIAAEGRAQLLAYPNVQWLDGTVTHARKDEAGFAIEADSGHSFRARRVVLATGVRDELPNIDGLAERWGSSVFHCPYCHGYELDNGRIGVLATGPNSIHQAMMLPEWGQVIFLTNNAIALEDAQYTELARRGVTIEARAVRRIVEHATVELQDGKALTFAGLFAVPKTHMASPLAEQLGCAFDEGPFGSVIRIEGVQSTTVPGVFACGDAARMAGNVAISVADGALAGVSAHRSLIFDSPL